ncbi:MAG TPA: hypothetical protein VG942_19455 [Hyphomonadaceae bacterium]|nr:hypothetical protein [Hyphomonadaceae bacterium]
MSIGKRLLPGMFAIALVAPAAAQATGSPVGLWAFQTTATEKGCSLSGEMIVSDSKDRRFPCSFKAVETCTQRLPRTIHTEQTCTLDQAGKTIAITSKLTRVVRVDPAEMMQEEVDGYLPDNFKLTINARGDQMLGAYASHRTAPAVFRRKQELVS